MEIQSDQNTLNESQSGSSSAVIHTGLGIVRWLIWFFTLTDEERLTAGVYVGGEDRGSSPGDLFSYPGLWSTDHVAFNSSIK